jgi:hypothetical protein
MTPHLLTVVLLIAAALSTMFGFDAVGLALFFLGAVLEVAFWVRAAQSSRHPLPLRASTAVRRR